MNLKSYRLMSDWRLIEIKELKIVYLEGIIESQLVRSERLISFNFDRREAIDYFTIYELGSVNSSFVNELETLGKLFSDFNFDIKKAIA